LLLRAMEIGWLSPGSFMRLAFQRLPTILPKSRGGAPTIR
jgi:hypothetical protein